MSDLQANENNSQTRDVLDRALQETLEARGLSDTPIADLAHRILKREKEGIHSRGETQPSVIRMIEQWAADNTEWVTSWEGNR